MPIDSNNSNNSNPFNSRSRLGNLLSEAALGKRIQPNLFKLISRGSRAPTESPTESLT
jgi:hypothetical protein